MRTLAESTQLAEEIDQWQSADRDYEASIAHLYSEADVVRALRRFRRIGYGQALDTSDFSAVFHDAGQISGSATIE